MHITLSFFHLIAQVLLFIASISFYMNHITHKGNTYLYHALRVFTALLVTGLFGRIVFDLNVIYTGIYKNFDAVQSAISITKNFSLGVIMVYLVFKKK
jgi:Na+-translocating ferredoxin:NAD+ oxidoreductase RnfA subunit